MKVLFNNIGKSTNYLKNIELLHSNYNFFRKKHFSNLCISQLQKTLPDSKLFLTHSATGGLEIIAELIKIEKGDEVIMPSFTFVSTANAFVTKGAIPVFVDIEKERLNIDLNLIENLITPKTKAIVAVHYAGHPCDLNKIKALCKKHHLYLIEDAAMAYGNKYEGKQLGSIGDFGVISFDITKQISAVQGGLLIINNPDFIRRAGYLYHIGTNREDFIDGSVPYYEWVDVGSKYQMNELSAAVLYDQLLRSEEILAHRNILSKLYHYYLKPLELQGKIQLMSDDLIETNYHEFYILLKNQVERDQLSTFLLAQGVETMFHYIPLHNSSKGSDFGLKDLPNTIAISESLLRLPMHTELGENHVQYIVEKIITFFEKE
ncbi:MAG: dTDP-4-amino-4,6-dideoxygalactose transaminase [Crocinitomicaceae bacterium]|nr:dTDP-4-amino-4,6-dideoxygalactose transaminase [Crocinitomicaceae bacterium]